MRNTEKQDIPETDTDTWYINLSFSWLSLRTLCKNSITYFISDTQFLIKADTQKRKKTNTQNYTKTDTQKITKELE